MKKRIVSAVIALIIIIPLILIGGIWFQLGVCILGALAFKEIIDLKKSHQEYPTFMIFIGLISLVSLILSNNIDASIYNGFTYQLLALIIFAIIVPVIFYQENVYSSHDAFYLLGVVLFLGIVFNLFIILRLRNLWLFVFLLIIPIFNDIFAYLIGSKLGKHKMCPKISPNKTWEGSIGGLIFGSIAGVVFYGLMVNNITLGVIITTVVLSVVGQMGDLVMSRIKRENGIKDFSNIMPGHGGILDRLDSIIFVFIAYMFLMIL